MADTAACVRTLRRAIEIRGAERLSRELGVGAGQIDAWLTGNGRLPTLIFLRALDIVAEAGAYARVPSRV